MNVRDDKFKLAERIEDDATSKRNLQNCRERKSPSQRCNPLILSIKNPALTDTGKYSIGFLCSLDTTVSCNRRVLMDSESYIQITVIKNNAPSSNNDAISLFKAVELEIGQHVNENTWFKWMQYTAHTLTSDDCIACSSARPKLMTTPIPYHNDTDLICILTLFTDTVNDPIDPCYSLHVKLPVVQSKDIPDTWEIGSPSYTCFLRDTIKNCDIEGNLVNDIRIFEETFCNVTLTSDSYEYFDLLKNQVTPRADVWWLCSDLRLYPLLSESWIGMCTPIMLFLPFTIGPADSLTLTTKTQVFPNQHVSKRSLPYPTAKKPLGSFNDDIYISRIGTPVGVPNEFKAQDEIAAGVNSILFSWVTSNKNVNWINYLYYNQQRFINHTIQALEGIVEQLGPTSLMAWQNRLALDMLLAKEAGVCSMFKQECCTYIPNNTAPEGSICKALDKLKLLSAELSKNSGVPENTWFNRLYDLFGPWAATVVSIITALLVVVAILVVIGCCIVPCLRSLVERLITTALTKTPPTSNVFLLNARTMSHTCPEYCPVQTGRRRRFKYRIKRA